MRNIERNIRIITVVIIIVVIGFHPSFSIISVNYPALETLDFKISEFLDLQEGDDLSKSGKWKGYADKIKEARSVVKKVKDAGNFISRLSGNEDLISLPVGIQVESDNGDFTATLVIEEIKIFQNYTQLFVILELDAPMLGDVPMIFYSSDVKYSAKGGIVGGATIALMSDFPVNVFDRKAMLIFEGGKPSISRPIEKMDSNP